MLASFIRQVIRRHRTKRFEAGKLAYERGEFKNAARLLKSALRRDPRNAEVHLYAGLASYRLEECDEALQRFERAIALNPTEPKYLFHAAAAEYTLGRMDCAWKRCAEAVERKHDFSMCHHLMSRIALPGPPYTTWLPAIHELLQPRTYLEIGVDRGASLALVQPATRAVGIDPAPQLSQPLPPNAEVYRMTSDDYFTQRDVRADLGGLPIDLAFIDGLHRFEYALRDFINVELHSTPESTILVHDCCPLDRRTADRERTTAFYSGDVWRLILLLKKSRPELRIATVATAPTGLAIIRGLDPASRVLVLNFDALLAEFMALDYSALEQDKTTALNLIPNEQDKVHAFLLDAAS